MHRASPVASPLTLRRRIVIILQMHRVATANDKLGKPVPLEGQAAGADGGGGQAYGQPPQQQQQQQQPLLNRHCELSETPLYSSV